MIGSLRLSVLVAICMSAMAGGSLAATEAMAPLADIRSAGGQTASVEVVKGGFVVRGGESLTARVVAPDDAFICRLSPAVNRDVVQLSIGRVESLRCNSLYSPSRDQAITLESAHVELHWQKDHWQVAARSPLTVRLVPDFMKVERGQRYYRPLDRTYFKRAPAGWCSWYICGQCIDEDMIVRNTDWVAANLKKFGCDYIQIDDGWQGVGTGDGLNRDWYRTAAKFPHGMKWLADYIRHKGMKAGIWLIPFTTSDEAYFRKHPDLFVRRPDGSSPYEFRDPKTGKMDANWCGRFAVDPTSPAARRWYTDLFTMICDNWGYDYVKIDGQGGQAGICSEFHNRLANQTPSPSEGYRTSLADIKAVMGPKRLLLNCGGQNDSCGYCEGMRIGGDVCSHWTGVQTSMQGTMNWLYLNNICFRTDPDVVCVRPPMSLDQARFWATLLGITGQLLMASDDMPKLPEERVELLRRIFPVADIRPMDLHPVGGWPRIFDLRVALPGVGRWDVVALFNWEVLHPVSIRMDVKELGLPGGSYVFYDAWQKQLIGAASDGLTLSLPPTSCRLVVVRPQSVDPQLLGTSRHITQGADDLLQARWDQTTATWSGRSSLVAGDPYELRFTLPPGWTCNDPQAKVVGSLAVVTLVSKESKIVPWRISFRSGSSTPVLARPKVTSVARHGNTVALMWQPSTGIAYRVYRNGQLVDQTVGTKFVDRLRRAGTYRYTVSAIGWQGESAQTPPCEIVLPAVVRGDAKDAWITELKPVSQLADYRDAQTDRSTGDNPLRVGGKTYARGLGAHANSRLCYQLDNRYRRFEAEVGVDDEQHGAGTVVFQVFADDRKVFDSGVMRGNQPAKRVSVSLDGVDELALVVTDAGDGINSDHADWLNARLIGNH